MGFKKQYFSQDDSNPAPLVASCERRVKFEEVDVLGMVWHGRYPSYIEDGRISFGDKYGLTYQSFMENKTVAPIVQMNFDYKAPLRFDQIMQIETRLHWSVSARLNFSYIIQNSEGVVNATGYTVQLLTDIDGAVMLVAPEWLQKFQEKWRDNAWSK